MCLAHLLDSPLPTIIASTPVYYTNDISKALVFLVERHSFQGTSGDLLSLPY